MCAAILEGTRSVAQPKATVVFRIFMASSPDSSVHAHEPTSGPIREAWLLEVTAVAQRILAAGTLSRIDAVRAVIAAVPRPRTRVEELVLAGLVIEMTLGEPRRTRSDLNHYADKLGALVAAEPWNVLARRLALQIAARCREPLDVRRLARDVGVDETTLRKEFRQAFGVSPREYHIRARVAVALDLLATGDLKIGSIARQVGYLDEKNFFGAVRRFTGRTPAELRKLPLGVRQSMAAALIARPDALPTAHKQQHVGRDAGELPEQTVDGTRAPVELRTSMRLLREGRRNGT
jgi:AraC-like DNA-binding protein